MYTIWLLCLVSVLHRRPSCSAMRSWGITERHRIRRNHRQLIFARRHSKVPLPRWGIARPKHPLECFGCTLMSRQVDALIYRRTQKVYRLTIHFRLNKHIFCWNRFIVALIQLHTFMLELFQESMNDARVKWNVELYAINFPFVFIIIQAIAWQKPSFSLIRLIRVRCSVRNA